MAISTLKQVNIWEMKMFAPLEQLVAYTFQIIFIFNCVEYDSKWPILFPTHARKKGSVMPSLKKYSV